MESLDFIDSKKTPARSRSSGMIWNILTVLVLLATICIGLTMLLIFINPHSGLNPFPPPTIPPTVEIPTPTTTVRSLLPPTWTPSPTLEPTATNTPRPTPTPFPTDTPFVLITVTPTPTAEGTPEATPAFNFILQPGSPKALPSIYHEGCDWMGVAGQATALNGAPIVGLFIQLGGTLEGQLIETKLSMTGTAPGYGKAGYEFTISDQPIASNSTLYIQLVDQANLPISDKFYFETFDDCEKNLILINFMQVK